MTQAVVVTGANGFIGAHLVRKLLKAGYVVHALILKHSSLWRFEGIEHKVVLHEGLLNDTKRLPHVLKKISPIAFYHLASYGTYPDQNDTELMIQTNVIATTHLLESTLSIPYKRFIVLGSSSEYGNKSRPMKEDDILTPNNMYAVTKAAATHAAICFAKIHHKPIVILRPFSVCGAYEEKGRLVRSVIEAVLDQKPIKLGSGRTVRDFIFVDDLVDAMIHMTHHKKLLEGEIFNIGTGKQTSTATIVHLICKIANIDVPIHINSFPDRPWDTYTWRANMRKTHNILRFRPKHTLSQGLKKTILWYQDSLRRP